MPYHPVFTDEQGRSGPDLDAQCEAVDRHVAGCSSFVTTAFEEVESGRKGDHPQLVLAMVECRLRPCVLLAAKPDRLARDAQFLLGLEKAGVEFLAADMSHANRLTIGVMALVSDEEARAMSARTKAVLAAAKARDVQLGHPHFRPCDRGTAAGSRAAWSGQATRHAAGVPRPDGWSRSGVAARG